MRKASREMDAFDDAIARSLERTAVVRICNGTLVH